VFYRENDGLIILHNWFKDALLQKVGIVKAYWDEKIDVKVEKYSDLSEDELALLLSDPSIELVSQEVDVDDVTVDQFGNPVPRMSYDVKVRQRKDYGCVKIENVPPEEFLISKSAKSIQDSPFVAHRRLWALARRL
jgi:hypothetical protein